MALPTQTRQWVLTHNPTSLPTLSGPNPTFKQSNAAIPALKDNQVLLKVLYLSNDPAQRGWISYHANPERLYLPPVKVGDVMKARAVAEVVDSKAKGLKKGTIVTANAGWKEYRVADASECSPCADIPGLKPTHFLGALGMTGMTALYGLRDIAKADPADTVVVSGAAGATGSMVVQIAKNLIGCKRVVGIAGTAEKCRWVESLGADVCLNYKSPSFKDDLANATPDYANVYFDNVGGEILDLMLARMTRHGRVAACGAVSAYNSSEPMQFRNWFQVISLRIQILGFIVLDFAPKMAEGTRELIAAYKEGKIRIGDETEMVVDTAFEQIPRTWMMLFEGGNTGKLITKVKSGESASL